MGPSDWFISAGERGNRSTRLDARHPRGQAWTDGNRVRPLVHGATYFAELHARVSAMHDGDLLLFVDWRGDPDERLLGDHGTEVGSLFAAAARRGVDVRGLVRRSHRDRLAFSGEENRPPPGRRDQGGGRRGSARHARPHGWVPPREVRGAAPSVVSRGRHRVSRRHRPLPQQARRRAAPGEHSVARGYTRRWCGPATSSISRASTCGGRRCRPSSPRPCGGSPRCTSSRCCLRCPIRTGGFPTPPTSSAVNGSWTTSRPPAPVGSRSMASRTPGGQRSPFTPRSASSMTRASVGLDNFNRRSWTHDSEVSASVGSTPVAPALCENSWRVSTSGSSRMTMSPSPTTSWRSRDRPRDLETWHRTGRAGAAGPPGTPPAGPTAPAREPRPEPVHPGVATPLYRLVDPDGRPLDLRLRRRM